MRRLWISVQSLILFGTLAASLGQVACNNRSPIFENGVAGVSPPTAPTATPIPVITLSLSPPALFGGGSVVANLTISVPAAPAGSVLTVSSSDPAVAVPSSVTIPAGKTMASFSVTTQPVSADRQVMISASLPGRTVPATLNLWTELPTFFSFVSDPGHAVGRGELRRFTSSNARLDANCNASWVQIRIDGTGSDSREFWSATFGAPPGTPLRVGTYENARDGGIAPGFPTTAGPVLEISGNGSGCSAVGRFVVSEVDVAANGTVRRFRASFEQQCSTRPERMMGDVSITNPPPVSFVTTCIVR